MTRRDGLPLLVQDTPERFAITRLDRIPLDGGVSEDWLQRLLDAAPEVLPIETIDGRVEPPLWSLGREISTAAGAIDNLFLSRNGQVVLVETKLWRSPEARRQVVAQILDYAACVRHWHYADLDQLAERYKFVKLWDLVHPEGVDQHIWVDRVTLGCARVG